MAHATDTGGLEQRARAILPAHVYDFYAGGSGREATLRGNVAAWSRYLLLPRVLRDVSTVTTHVRLASPPHTALATPVAVAPTAFHGMAHPAGEIATAQGTARAGALLVLSTRSSRRYEEVGATVAAEGGAWWFQVYVLGNRELTARLVRRAVAAGAQALVLTADTPVVGRKRRNRADGMIPAADLEINTGAVADAADAEQAPDVTFDDIAWLADIGQVPVLIKGVLRADDAAACLAAGAAGVIVSNHGGRQLDQAMPTAAALPAVAAAAPGRTYADGGVRTATDILVALALGAQAVFLGRPILWALTCGGADGVADLLTGLTSELAHLMALAGAPSVADLRGVAGPPLGRGAGAAQW